VCLIDIPVNHTPCVVQVGQETMTNRVGALAVFILIKYEEGSHYGRWVTVARRIQAASFLGATSFR
jgi:hypothetical protein